MIELKNVDKKFQDIHAADHITASVRDGLIFGLVGSNGAGKSTLLRMICGVVKPDSGGWGVCIRESGGKITDLFFVRFAILFCQCKYRRNAGLLYDNLSCV